MSQLRGVAPFPRALGKGNGDEKVLEETLEKVLRGRDMETLSLSLNGPSLASEVQKDEGHPSELAKGGDKGNSFLSPL